MTSSLRSLRIILTLFLCLAIIILPMSISVSAEDDAVTEVTALLEEIDSLQEMQDARKTFTVSAVYNADNPDTVAEHEAVQAAYKKYVADMFAKRDAAQTAYDQLTNEQKAEIDPALVAKLTDVLTTSFSDESYQLTPRDDEYNYQVIQISSNYYLAYELSMHTTKDKDMPCLIILVDTSDGSTSFTPDGPYEYGTNNYELTYCCDEREPTTFLAHYKRINLEDCEYYNSYQASKIRAIITNAYPFISLEEMKANLKAAGLEHADELDRADIIAAVQFAVWYFSNRMTNGQITSDTSYGSTANAIAYRAGGSRPLISSVHDYRNELWYWWNANNYRDWAYDADADARVTELFDYLIGLPGITASENQFIISEIQLARTSLKEGSNDTYILGLNIVLNHGASAGDEVKMTVTTPWDTQEIDVTGQSSYAVDIEAKYGDTVNVSVTGTQELEKGVYFYEPEGGYDASQSLVGVAEGTTHVRADNSFVFERDIEGGIRIYKTEEGTDRPLENIMFSIYNVPAGQTISETPTDEEVAAIAVEENLAATAMTDKTGYAAIELGRGTYLVVEEASDQVKKPVDPVYVTIPTEDGEDIAELHFVNKPADEPGTVSVNFEVTKEFEDWGKADEFTFELEAVTEGAPMPEETTAMATEDEPTAQFDDILFVEPGTYEYTITEVNDGADGVSYDTTPHRVVVTVTEVTIPADDDYLLDNYYFEAEVEYDGDESLIITNTFTPAEASIDVTKLLEGREWKDSDEFVVTLASADAPMPDTTELTLTKNAQEGTFGPITFDKAGTYEYTVTETAGSEEGMTYDTAEHTVTVTVTKADDATNALTAAVEYSEGNSVEIMNVYEEETSIEEETASEEEITTEETTTEKATTAPTSETKTSPSTGDENKPIIWVIVAVAAALGIVIAVILLTRKKKE